MIDRFLDFLGAPLSRRAAQAVLVLTAAVSHGYVLLALLSLAAGDEGSRRTDRDGSGEQTVSVRPVESNDSTRVPRPRQDPQDWPGTRWSRRADRALRSHRALQQVPFRTAKATIVLANARRGMAVLRVTAPSADDGRAAWRRFLRRFHDSGEGYISVFISSRRAK